VPRPFMSHGAGFTPYERGRGEKPVLIEDIEENTAMASRQNATTIAESRAVVWLAHVVRNEIGRIAQDVR